MRILFFILFIFTFKTTLTGQITPGTYKLQLSAWNYRAQLDLNKDSSIYYKIYNNGNDGQVPYYGNWYVIKDTLFIVCKLDVVDNGIDQAYAYDPSIRGILVSFKTAKGQPLQQAASICKKCLPERDCVTKVTDKNGNIYFEKVPTPDTCYSTSIVFDHEDNSCDIGLSSMPHYNIFKITIREDHEKFKTFSTVEKYLIRGDKLYSANPKSATTFPFMKNEECFILNDQ